MTSRNKELLTLRPPPANYVSLAALSTVAWLLPAMKLPKHKKLFCSCLTQLEAQAHHLKNFKRSYHRLQTLSSMQHTLRKTVMFLETIECGSVMTMIGKELLSGLWECRDCLHMSHATSHSSSPHTCFTLLSHHFRCYAALSLLAAKCVSWAVMPWRLALCDLGDPGWGDPRFLHSVVLLCSHEGMVWWWWWFSWAFLAHLCVVQLAMPISEMIQCYHLTIFSSFALDRSLPMHVLPFVGVVCGLFSFVSLFVCVFCCFLYNGIVTAADYVQVHCQTTFWTIIWLGFLH